MIQVRFRFKVSSMISVEFVIKVKITVKVRDSFVVCI